MSPLRTRRMKRILLKLSGEALGGNQGHGFKSEILKSIGQQIRDAVHQEIEIGLVVGGGNLFRGVQGMSEGLDRNSGDLMGMLATVMNALALRGVFTSLGLSVQVQSAFEVGSFVEGFSVFKAREYLSSGNVVIFCGGTGNPFFTTDSAAALRAAEIGADLLIKGTKVDGVYDKDPVTNPGAKKYRHLNYQTVLEKRLAVMDLTAITLCQENKIPIRVVDIMDGNPILRLAEGEEIGTLIS